MSEFTHLHVHTHYSLLDSSIRIDNLIEAASNDKMEAVAITDNGNLFGALDFYVKAKEAGIKPIIGCEMYLAPGSRKMRGNHPSVDEELAPYTPSRTGIQHIILLCQNEEGYHNLCKLVSMGYLEGFYYIPRIDKEVLAQYSGGLIATSACLKGELSNLALIGDMDRAREAAKWYQSVFPNRFFLELQQNGIPQQMLINQRLLELSHELRIPVVATADCHYLTKADAFSHEVLMSIKTGKELEDPTGESIKTNEFYFKPQTTITQEFQFCPDAISNTMEIAKSVHFEFRFTDNEGRKIYHFPKFEPPEGKNAVSYLDENSKKGLEKRLLEFEMLGTRTFSADERNRYFERLARELSVINEMGFTGYFLIVADFIQYAKENGIPVGPGRGSGAGSLVAYSLRITELDPIEHGLLFERFLNPERVSLPDFDIDFCMEKRDRIIQYVCQKYGSECVAQIITFGKLQARGVIRDVGRVFGYTPSEIDKVAKLVPESLNITLKEAFEQESRLRDLNKTDPKMHRLFKACESLEGLCRHASIHAAGLVISNRPMVEHCPLYRGKNDELVIQFDMNNADRIGLIKFDFLGLKTLTFLHRAEELVNERHPEIHLDLNHLDLNDKKMFEMLGRGDTAGVFQLESAGMQDLMKKLRPDTFEDIVASNALHRPGPIGSGMLDDFIGRKQGLIPVQYDFDILMPVLKETYGVIVYQEQVQQIAMRLAAYTAGSADILRRAMGKKKPEEMAKQKQFFLKGVQESGYDVSKAEKLFELMEKFAGYGFNKSHAAAYSLITCQTAYLKAHYLVEFYAALLSIERENTDKISKYILDAKRHGISVLPPDINESETDFTILSDQEIRFGLGAIKGVGQVAIDCILESRKSRGPFQDLFDLCVRTSSQRVNKRVLEAFVKAGALDSFKVNRASIFKAIDSALDLGANLQKINDENQPTFADLMGLDGAQVFSERKVTYPEEPPWGRLIELKYEKETIGFFVTGHPLDDFIAELQQYTTVHIGDCLLATSPRECMIGAEIVSLREIHTRRGDRMAFVTLEDATGQIEAVVFSDIYVDSESVLKCGEPVWVKGQLEIGEKGKKLILSRKNNAKLLPLRHAYEFLAREIHLKWDAPENGLKNGLFDRFKEFLERNRNNGGVPVFLHINLQDHTQTVFKLKESLHPSRENVKYLKSIFGEKTQIEFK